MNKEDKGAHYRNHSVTCKHCKKETAIDVYDVWNAFSVEAGPRSHAIKKLLRFTDKGHSPEDLIAELRCCIDRLEEMICTMEN